MAEKIKWSRTQVEHLIYLIEQNSKAQALHKICEEMNILGLNIQEIKKKWENIRSQYLREVRKMKASKKVDQETPTCMRPNYGVFKIQNSG